MVRLVVDGAPDGDTPINAVGLADPRRLFSAQEAALLAALVDRNPNLARIYLGSCLVRRDGTNPERLPLTAHALRELMDLMAEVLDTPIPTEPPGLKVKVNELRASFTKIASKAGTAGEAKAVASFVAASEKFFAWYDQELPARKARTAAVLKEIDPSRGALPPAIEGLRIKEWFEYNDFFNQVAHHRRPDCLDDEFDGFVDGLERFLLDYLKPRTFEDYAGIDALIAEGERQ